MLESLNIRNYAIIDEMTVGFTGGLTVITGETGAGKSIVVDALELALGARASMEMIRADAEEMEVSCVFSHDNNLKNEALSEFGSEETLILRRVIRADGVGRCFINDTPVTLKKLREIGDSLVDFHGQHDHQSLLDSAGHVKFLDGFGDSAKLKTEVERLYKEFLDIRTSIETLKQRIETARRDRELYRFQIKEINLAQLTPNEDRELQLTIKRLSRAAELKNFCLRAFQELSESEASVGETLGGLTGQLENHSEADPMVVPYVEKLEELTSGASELASDLRRYSETINDNPETLAELDERLSLIEQLKKKYGPGLDDVLSYRERISKTFEGLENDVQNCEKLEIILEEIKPRLYKKASDLSKQRKRNAPNLSAQVEVHLNELGMTDARLVIDISELKNGETFETYDKAVTISEQGLDNVDFMFTANPGVPPRHLTKVASGGEISRVMLSLKLALSKADKVPTMVFDEIDSGVSGRIAESVGEKLNKLAESRQVVVITHLPQIGSKAQSHYSARKSVNEGRTQVQLLVLDDTMRQEELASMLSGEKLTETAIAHAKELMKKEKAQRHKGTEAEGEREKTGDK